MRTGSGRRVTLLGLFFLCCLAGMLVLSSCGGPAVPAGPSSETPKKGGTLNVGLIAEPANMDPLTSASLYDADIQVHIYDRLFKYDANNTIQPYLVSSYQYVSDTQLDLTLHDGIKFQDGTPLNADAVIFNLKRFMDFKTGPRYTDVQTIDSVTKVAENKLSIKLKQPFAPLLNNLTGASGYVISPTAIQKLGADALKNAPLNAGSGPFTFVEWIKSDHLLIKANPNYWKKDKNGTQLPYLDSIRYRTITNANVMYNNLETNQIQVASNIDPTNVSTIKANPNLTYKQVIGTGFTSLQLNIAKPPLDNLHVRRAIAFALNREEIVHLVLKDVGAPAKGPVSPTVWSYDKNYSGITYDEAKAKQEVTQSGLNNITFTLEVTGGNPTTDQEVQLIQSQLEKVGIKMQVKNQVFATVVQDLQTFNYESIFIGWTGALDPDGVMYLMFHSKGGFNYTKYANSQVDQALDTARTTIDQKKRMELYQQAEKQIVEDASRVFINHGAVAQSSSTKVKNYVVYPSGVLDFVEVFLG